LGCAFFCASFRRAPEPPWSIECPLPESDLCDSAPGLHVKRKFAFSSGGNVICARICAIVVAVALALPVLASNSDDIVHCRTGSTRHEIAKSLLPAQSALAHSPVQVSLPPSKRSLVVLYRKADDVDTNYRGWVLVPAAPPCSYQRYSLPEMDEAPTQFQIDVQSVFSAEVGSGRERVLVVLYRYHRNGSADDSGYASYVYGWNGHSFDSLSKPAEALVGLRTAAQVRRKLRKVR